MHSLTICFGPAGTVWTLLFKDEEGAQRARSALASGDDRFSCTDDYGQRVVLSTGALHGYMFEDMDQSQMAAVERGLHNARSQAKAQSRAMADPTLKASMMAQGPAVLSGGMPNGRFS